MSSSARRRGFTLLEVMAAVLVLGLLYTWLVNVAIVGLRSEGTDRRRADADLIADLELSLIEASVSVGQLPEDGRSERDEDPYRVLVEIAPIDVLSLLPAPLAKDIAQRSDPRAPSVLHDERGESRVRRVSVVVEWDEAGEPAQVERTTYAYDKSELALFFPPSEGSENAAEAAGDGMQELFDASPPELKALMPMEKKPKFAPQRSR